MVGIAALNEKIISPSREIFSPGYLEIPNPYHPENPSKFLDWRYQGNVNLGAAIAQSSNVYFYAVGGGALGIKGLGIGKLRQWWQKFGLGKKTGIDMPGEEDGFLPDPDWKQKTQGRPWLLGDTYNVSIGQGDLLLTPMQLAVYAAGLANGGKFFRPYVSSDNNVPAVNIDLSYLKNEFREVQKGMRQTVTSPLGTAKLLDNLPMATAAKTGSAQIKNNTQENAFFIGYAPYENPQIAIMVMIENSKEGSLNAVPVARDVFSWYYENRVKKVGETVTSLSTRSAVRAQ
jgi:penicillin-binding protein 2